MKRFTFWGACTDMPCGEIIWYITYPIRSQKIAYSTFTKQVDLDDMREINHPALYRISCKDNWQIAFFKSQLPLGDPIFYFKWSGIEHIFTASDTSPHAECLAARMIRANPLKPNELKAQLTGVELEDGYEKQSLLDL